MSSNQLRRRIFAMSAQLAQMSQRIEVLARQLEPQDKPKGARRPSKASKKTSSKNKGGGSRLRAIGQVLPYLGGKVKVVERKNGKYYVKALKNIEGRGRKIAKGKIFAVGSVWVYKHAA